MPRRPTLRYRQSAEPQDGFERLVRGLNGAKPRRASLCAQPGRTSQGSWREMRLAMTALNKKSAHLDPLEVEALLPWHAAGTLDARDTRRVEEALARDPFLAP